MKQLLSPSRIAAAALGLTPVGHPWGGAPGTLLCALERRPLEPGEPCLPFKPGPNFLDNTSITDSSVISGAAALFMAKAVMLKTQRAVFSGEGAFSLATDAARAWFFLTPPKPPYVAVIADSMLQHLIWRAPVNLSQDLIRFRHGHKLLTVRRPRLIEAMRVLNALDAPAFVALDRDGKHPGHGVLRASCPPEIARQLVDLTPGELLALATLAKKNPVTPARPEPIQLNALSNGDSSDFD